MTTTRSSKRSTTKRATTRAVVATLALCAAAGSLTGCRGDRTDKPPRRFFPDMDYQPKIKAQSETEFFSDGKGQRPLVEGTVPFGSTTHSNATLEHASWGGTFLEERAAILGSNRAFSTGLQDGSDTEYVATMPIEMTRELIERGHERFDIYCSMCHGYDGLGGSSGTVGRLWSIPPANLAMDPNFQDRSAERGRDGYLYHIVREGLYTEDGTIRMPSYKHAVDEHDAWAIVAYLRVLQAAHTVDPSELDPSVRAALGDAPEPESDNTETTDTNGGGEG